MICQHKYKHVPEYYRFMYLDGYTPDEIMYASRKKIFSEINKQSENLVSDLDIKKAIDSAIDKEIQKLFEDWK